MSSKYALIENDNTGTHHIIDRQNGTRPVPATDGGVTTTAVALCGKPVDEPSREFKGFDAYRDITFCDMCRKIHDQHQNGGRLFS